MSLLLCTNWGLVAPGFLSANTASQEAALAANLGYKGYNSSLGPQKYVDGAESRRSGAYLMDTGPGLSPSSALGWVQYLNAEQSALSVTYPRTLVMGWACRIHTPPSNQSQWSSGPWGLHSTIFSGRYYFPVGVKAAGDGSLMIGHGATYSSTSPWTLIAQSASFLPRDGQYRWYYLELKVVMTSATSWQAELVVDGTTRIPLTSAFDPASSNPNITGLMFFSDLNYNSGVSDVYLLDDTGTVNNDYLGDCRVESLRPTSVGGVQQWDVVGAADATDAVDDTTIDLDTGYLRAPGVPTRSTFALGNLAATTGTVRGVAVMASAKKEGSNARIIKPAVRVGGTTYDGPAGDFSPYQGGYRPVTGIFEVNPATDDTWTATEINAMEAGVSLTA